MSLSTQIKEYLKFYSKADTVYGFHSPTLYLMASTVYSKKNIGLFDDIEKVRSDLLNDNSTIRFEEYGAGSTTTSSNIKTVAQIAKSSLSGRRQCKQLLNLVHNYKPKTILEMGTSLGVSTAYMARGNPESNIISLEGDPTVKNLAEANFQALGINNIQVIEGRFGDTLTPTLDKLKTIDMAFIDGNHRLKPTLEYFNTILPYTSDSSIIVFDDIYWSVEMKEAWQEIKGHEAVKLTIDLFHMGIVLLSPEIKVKQHLHLIELAYKPWRLGLFG